jgi:hypothetical protein
MKRETFDSDPLSEGKYEEVADEEVKPRVSIKDIKDLIDIREYMSKIAESSTVPKKDAYQTINLLPYVDKKIIAYILSDDFREAIGANDRSPEPIKSSLKK